MENYIFVKSVYYTSQGELVVNIFLLGGVGGWGRVVSKRGASRTRMGRVGSGASCPDSNLYAVEFRARVVMRVL